MATIKLRGGIDLEQLHDICAGVTATVEVRADDDALTLLLTGDDATGCAELLVDWLGTAGVEVMQPVETSVVF